VRVQFLQYLLLGFAPGIFWLWWFQRKDDLEPEPRSLVLRVFALGCGSALLVLLVRPLIEPALLPDGGWWRDVVDAFVVTGATEELAKLAAFFLGAFFHRELDEPLDGIVYGVAAGLGFASVENVVYLIQLDDAKIVVLRAFTATLGHVAFTGSMGFFFGLAKLSRGAGRAALLMLAGLTLAVLFHGLYDVFLFRGGSLAFLSLLGGLPLLQVLIGLKIRWARARSARYHPDLE
jgi:RsiW-degrading membrane proteinase PrsW (M82 family)